MKGKDWVRRIDPDDLKAFARVGLEASDYGKKGGRAVVAKLGTEHMREIGRRGALVRNLRKWWDQQVVIETERIRWDDLENQYTESLMYSIQKRLDELPLKHKIKLIHKLIHYLETEEDFSNAQV